MKFILFSLLVSFLCLPVIGQQSTNENSQKNNISIIATDLINGSYTIAYERTIGKHTSVDFGFGYKTKDGLVKLSGIDEDQIKTNQLTYSGFKLMPEFRYYINASDKGELNGFYFGAYLKYSNLKSDLIGTFIDSNDDSFEIAYEGKITVNSVGFMVGYKLPISKNIYVDFLIAGPGSGFYNFDLKNTIPPPDEFYDVLNAALDKYSFFDFINSDFKFRNNRLKTNFSTLSFRYGISLGYNF